MLSSTQATSTYNILLLGPTQSGKSTLLEGIRRYVDPNYSIDEQAIGNGHRPHTSEIRVLELKAGIKEMERGGLWKSDRGASQAVFKVIDTPGFDNTTDRNEMHAATILRELGSLGHVNLMLFTISRHTPTTQGFLMALMAYSNLFSALRGNMTLLHTHLQIKNESKHQDAQARREYIFQDVMFKHIPQFSIDCDLDETQPMLVREQDHTIRQILLQAMENTPRALHSVIPLQKTPRMRTIDNMVRMSYLSKIKGLDGSNPPPRTVEIDLSFKIQEAKEFLDHHDTQDLEPMSEVWCARDRKTCNLFTVRRDVVLHLKDLDCTLEGLDKDLSEVVEGRVDRGQWHMRSVGRKNKQGRVHYAKLYAKRCEKYRAEIDENKAKIVGWRRALDDALWDRHVQEEISDGEVAHLLRLEPSPPRLQRTNSKELSYYSNMVDCLSRRTIQLDLFMAMAEAGAYEGSHLECMWKIEAFYENKYCHGQALSSMKE
ncbi:hypothetical protein BGZ67_002490 [Mortierella alpina]|nr:hypothetical protein BGZ67_002490 [Mortierella alpina]